MDIDNLTEADLTDLAALYKDFWGEDSVPEKMRATFRRLDVNPSYILLSAKQDGKLIGSAMGIICEELYGNCQPFMVIEDVVVNKAYRRFGVGSALMGELEKRAVERSCHYIIFVTESERTGAHRFYTSLGYNPEAHRGFKKYLKNPFS